MPGRGSSDGEKPSETSTLGWFGDQLAGTTSVTFPVGGATDQGLVSAGTVATLP